MLNKNGSKDYLEALEALGVLVVDEEAEAVTLLVGVFAVVVVEVEVVVVVVLAVAVVVGGASTLWCLRIPMKAFFSFSVWNRP